MCIYVYDVRQFVLTITDELSKSKGLKCDWREAFLHEVMKGFLRKSSLNHWNIKKLDEN